MFRKILNPSKPPALWSGYSVIAAAGLADLAVGQVAISTSLCIVTLLGGFFTDRNLRHICCVVIACMVLVSAFSPQWSDACLRAGVVILSVVVWWLSLKSAPDPNADSHVQTSSVASGAAGNGAAGSGAAGNGPAGSGPAGNGAIGGNAEQEPAFGTGSRWGSAGQPDRVGLTSVIADGSAESSDMSFDSGVLENLLKRDSRDDSTTAPGFRPPVGVPILVRLLDTGVFSDAQSKSIADVLSEAPDIRTGLKRCIKQGILTGLQAEMIEDGKERQLRVGNYSLLSRIGRGGMGEIYRALDRERQQLVALKLFLQSERDLMFIRREMSALNELAHPNLVTAYETGDSDGYHYIAMELLEGTNLMQLVEQDGPLSESEAIHAAWQVAQALVHMHERGIWHRDVKPSNVMKCPRGTYKLMDLGICRPSDALREFDSMDLNHSTVFGTAGFASPEQIDRNLTTNASSDVYALGGLLFYLVTGNCYVQGENSRGRFYNLLVKRRFRDLDQSGLSDSLTAVLRHFLIYEQENRCQSAREASEMLKRLMNEEERRERERRVRVLVVEDDPTDFALTKRLLERTNRSIEIQHATTFKDATNRLADPLPDANNRTQREAHEPWVVLLDLSLPDSDQEMTLKSLPSLKGDRVGVVAVTGDDRADTRARCFAAGASEFVPKTRIDSRLLERAVFACFSRLNRSESPTTEVNR